MTAGVVWTGRPRTVLMTVCLAVGVAPLLGAGPAAAAEGKPAPVLQGRATVTGTLWGDKHADRAALDGYGRNEAKQDPGSLYTVTAAIGARDVWKQRDGLGRAVTGQGVTVAVLDSGVAGVPGLDGAGKLVQGPDLSLEVNSAAPLPTDTFGHGTHMAGIIAASDVVARDPRTGEPKGDDASRELGVAPDARVLALKLATTDGSTDVSQVIAGLDWVVEHRHDNGMDVRVVNLSFGTASLQPYQVDPLAAAAENAWRQGLVVVVSGGNGGADGRGLTDPAIDPYVLAVGASDPKGRVDGYKEPRVADFSSRGTATRSVDVLAPGTSIVGLRAPGSFVDVMHPEGLVAGDVSGRLFRGSGTSQAAAVTSGAAALLLQAYPELTPDAVKAALVATATTTKHADVRAYGAGQIDVRAALDAVKRASSTRGPVAATLLGARQTWPVADGSGSLEAARGGAHLTDPDTGLVLQGEVDVQGLPWDGPAWARASAAGTAWSGGTWMRARWSGEAWTSAGWARARWSDSSWSRARWSDAAWERARWSGDAWERARWSGSDWA